MEVQDVIKIQQRLTSIKQLMVQDPHDAARLGKIADITQEHMQAECPHEFIRNGKQPCEVQCKHCGVDEDNAIQVRQSYLQRELEDRRRALARAGTPVAQLPMAMFVS